MRIAFAFAISAISVLSPNCAAHAAGDDAIQRLARTRVPGNDSEYLPFLGECPANVMDGSDRARPELLMAGGQRILDVDYAWQIFQAVEPKRFCVLLTAPYFKALSEFDAAVLWSTAVDYGENNWPAFPDIRINPLPKEILDRIDRAEGNIRKITAEQHREARRLRNENEEASKHEQPVSGVDSKRRP